ncbi:hypothetical protein R1sor_012752 [Riccia sorocarpa]|uniref:ZSWIM1/3 RNaseH-like domain-containing protein n=1 Tax=Riccia sorocarpa TaxID=122646 RepID=A0ABD3I5B5_9MARC
MAGQMVLAESSSRFNSNLVQLPPEGRLFTSDDLVWYSCRKAGRTGGDREEAWIPAERLKDFIKGESTRAQFQCSFNVRKTEKRKKSGMHIKTYWCCYGPLDEREATMHNWAELQLAAKEAGKKGRGRGSKPAALTVEVGLSMRRGCRCHFNIFTDPNREDAVLISWVVRQHIDKDGQTCHGLLCKDAKITNHQIAPKLSEECVQFVERLLRSRVPPSEIMLEHQQRVAEIVRNADSSKSIGWTRDMHLTAQDIRNIQNRLRRDGQLYHTNDAQAVRQWSERFPDHVLHYEEQNKTEGKLFCLVFCTPWMLRNLAIYGHEGAVCLDATHGTNLYGFQLFTWLVYDKHQNGILVVWALMERHKTEDLVVVQQKIKKAVETQHEDTVGENFIPSCFSTDDCAEEKASISYRLLTENCTWDRDPVYVSEAFLSKWGPIEPCFVKYFNDTWVPKLKEWVLQYRTHKRSNQNTSGAVERWHSTLKAHIRSARMTKARRKLSWLVVLLTSTLELYFWCYAELKRQGRIRNRVVEDQVTTICVKAKSILDCYMQIVEEGGFKVKALLMDGITETEIVKSLGRKYGSEVGGSINLERDGGFSLNLHGSEDQLLEDPTFHFPCRDAIQDVSNMRARILEGTWSTMDVTRAIPHPIEVEATDNSTELNRKKRWYERMMEGYGKNEVEQDIAIPLERATKEQHVTMNQTFDAEALQHLLGGNGADPKGKKRKTKVHTRGGHTSRGKTHKVSRPHTVDAITTLQ